MVSFISPAWQGSVSVVSACVSCTFSGGANTARVKLASLNYLAISKTPHYSECRGSYSILYAAGYVIATVDSFPRTGTRVLLTKVIVTSARTASLTRVRNTLSDFRRTVRTAYVWTLLNPPFRALALREGHFQSSDIFCLHIVSSVSTVYRMHVVGFDDPR